MKVRYAPAPGARFTAPTLTPGAVLDVSAGEAEHLVATGAFELVVEAEAVGELGEVEVAARARPRKGRE